MTSYEIVEYSLDMFPVFQIRGYFSQETGEELHDRVAEFLKAGKNRLVIDFELCKAVNSPGVVAVMELALNIAEDHQGRLVIMGIDGIKKSVFQMAGIFPIADLALGRQEALVLLQKD